MLHYVVRLAHRYTIDRYLAVWGHRLARHFTVIPYERLRLQRYFAAGAYLFTDIDRIDPATRRLAAHIAAKVRGCGNTVLNDPGRVLSRFDLLRRLSDDGRNDFCAYREPDWPLVRFPAFLRRANDHNGSLTPLLSNLSELNAAAAALPAGVPRDDVIAVEFVDTRDAAGIFRKYSVHRIGKHYIPRHVMCSREWVGKYADLVGPAELQQEAAFLACNPFDSEVRAAFEVAGIDYGRIDFGVAAGRVQVWEINTNPSIAPETDRINPNRFAMVRQSVQELTTAFGELADSSGSDCKLRIGRAHRREFGLSLRDALSEAAARIYRRGCHTAAGKYAAQWRQRNI